MDLYLALEKGLKLDIGHVIKYESYCMSHKYSDINNGIVIHPTMIWASRNVNFSAWLLNILLLDPLKQGILENSIEI